MPRLAYKILVIFVVLVFSKEIHGEKDLKFEGKGKNNELVARAAFCRTVCFDKAERGHPAEQFTDPWVESHQLCACWDSDSYRKNIENANCKREKDKPVYLLEGRIYTCNKMCKKYLTDLTSFEKIQLREAWMCYAKMQYGHTATCVCDFKWA